MRPMDRMLPTLEAVAALWKQPECRDMRLGQLLWLIAGRDPFFIEDDDIQAVCAEMLEEMRRAALKAP